MIDLRSDTVTTPTQAMRDAARDAAVGDDVYREDPSVNELEEAAAELLGHEAALFCPSGTMANQVAVRTHTEQGQEAIVDRRAHVYDWEVGGLVEHAGLQPRAFEHVGDGPDRGVPEPDAVRAAYVEESVHRAGTGLLCLENTHNARGGLAIEPERIDAAARAAHELDVPVHLDGARLCNAAVARDVPPARYTRHVDSTMLSLSKGLGAPVGSMLAGSEAFVERARRNRKLHGGAMRQAGVIAAPGRLALDAVDRLADDHENAAALAAGLDELPGIDARPPETNIVLVETHWLAERAGDDSDGGGEEGDGGERGSGDGGRGSAVAFQERCADAGVQCTTMAEDVARFCTHRDVDAGDVDAAVERIADVLAA